MALWLGCPNATSFQRPQWLISWIQAFKPHQLYVIEVRYQQRLVGLAPLFLYKSGRESILAPIGAGISDYLDWLIDPAHSSSVLPLILNFLERSDLNWNRLEVSDISPQSALAQPAAFRDYDCELSLDAACLELPSSFEELEENLPAKFRHNLRTARRRIARAGQVSVEIATHETLDEFLSALLGLHGARWNELGMPGVLADGAVRQFHRLAATALLQQGILRLYGLRLSGQLIATLYALSEPSITYCYLQAFDPNYRQFSPGVQILSAVIEDAIRHGKRAADFLRGREAYKYLWGAADRQTYRLSLRRSVPSVHKAA
jgi:CelD/BcsL family acetyltransferase involved in cellulose biosynthesis